MKTLKNKTVTLITLILMLTIVLPLFVLPNNANAASTRMTYAYIGVTPNPMGVGQQTLLHIGVTQPYNAVRGGWEDLTVTVTRPDGTTETLGPFKTDPTGGLGHIYVPSMTGDYTFQTHFPETVNPIRQTGATSMEVGTILLASDSRILTVVVQDQSLSLYPGHPLPEEYWSRPIDGQLREWANIAGNWQRSPDNLVTVGNDNALETAHILWAKPITGGGIAGGETGEHTWTSGDAYQGQFASSVIMNGVLYYNIYPSSGAKAGYPIQGIKAVDLRTGEELWFKDDVRLSFGQLLYVDSMNMHGVFGYLWSVTGNTWNAYDPFNGEYLYSIYNVPRGTTVLGPNNEILIYTVNNNGWVTLWNSTTVVNLSPRWEFGRYWNPNGQNLTASLGYTWNKTTTVGLSGTAYAALNDKIVGQTISTTEINTWAISVKPGQEGQLLYNTTWMAPADWAAGNQTISRAAGSITDGLVAVWSKETQQFWGFSTDTGDCIWGPTLPQNYLDYLGRHSYIVDGKLIAQGMSGIVYCYDAKTGEQLWTYLADDLYNQVLWSNQWHIRPLFFADGKLYMGTSEHSPVDPKPRGAPFVCIEIENGTEVFRANGLFRQTDWGGRAIIGDNIMATLDTYDQRIYAVGKGPSALTVNAPDVSVDFGKSVVLNGRVTDISAGTQEYALAARFPNGVPAVSDNSMSAWMLYVYKQFERPTNATGVEVSIDVIDSNGNYRPIGTTTSDSSGMFTYTWTPDIEGSYTVIATFAGSESYWPSYSETSFAVDPAAPLPAPIDLPLQSTADLYFAPAVAGIIVAIIIVGVVLALLMLRKRP